MYVAVLGPLEVDLDGRPVAVAGARLRRLLTRLAVDAGRAVSTAELVEAVWLDDPPQDTGNALQSLASRLRRLLGDPALVTQSAAGYRLAVTPDRTDLHRFAALAGQGRTLVTSDPQSACDRLDDALALWRGPPLSDADDAGYAAPAAARLDEQRLGALADRAAAGIRLGRAAAVATDLESLVAAYPLRERFTALLMEALDADGRPAEALAAHERTRERLADELGADPGPAMRDLHLAILQGTTARPAPTNLRASLTRFVGRERELARVERLLGEGRLTTVIGPGGAGKTRISAEVGVRRKEAYADGVWLVELAPLSDPAAVPQATLATLGVRDSALLERASERVGSRDTRGRLIDTLRDADLLLVMDNCEHLLDAVAELVTEVLAVCPGVRVLATSREPLGVPGESLCLLPPLGLPPEHATAEEALTYPSVQLLAERAAAVAADFRVDSTTVGHVVEIARRLDGLPLALELAAARLRVLPVAEVAARLTDRFRLLTGGNRAALPRHRTLRAVVEWSWELLTTDERLLAERLAVFPAGATADTATAVCGDTRLPADDVPDLLVALADKSLLQVTDDAGVRYRMLETIREYGVERLVERHEIDAARRAHAAYFLGLFEQQDPLLRTDKQLDALAVLVAEHDNAIAALRYLADAGDADRALRITAVLSWFWTLTGATERARVTTDVVLAATTGVDHPLRPYIEAQALVGGFGWDGFKDDLSWDELVARMRVALARLPDADDDIPAPLRILRPMLAFFAGDEEAMTRAVALVERTDDDWLTAVVHSARAAMNENSGDIEAMRADVDAAYTAFLSIGDRWGLSATLPSRAVIRTYDGDLAGATADYERARAYVAEIGSSEDDLLIGLRLADLQVRLGRYDEAHVYLDAARQAVAAAPQGRDRRLIVESAAVSLLLREGRAREAGAALRRIQADLPVRVGRTPLSGHLIAIVGATAVQAYLELGDPDEATRQLGPAYEAGRQTRDLPILAVVGVATASLLLHVGRLEQAARVLGAAAALRGADDPTDPTILRLRGALRTELGQAGFAAAYAEGRALPKDAASAALDPAHLDAPHLGAVHPDTEHPDTELSGAGRALARPAPDN